MKKLFLKTGLPLLCATLIFAGCGVDQEGRGNNKLVRQQQSNNQNQTYTSKYARTKSDTGVNHRRGLGSMDNYTGAGTHRRVDTYGGNAYSGYTYGPGRAGFGSSTFGDIAGGGSQYGRTYGAYNRYGMTPNLNSYGTSGMGAYGTGTNGMSTRNNQGVASIAGVSSRIQAMINQQGNAGVKVLILGDTVVVGRSNTGGTLTGTGTTTGTAGTTTGAGTMGTKSTGMTGGTGNITGRAGMSGTPSITGTNVGTKAYGTNNDGGFFDRMFGDNNGRTGTYGTGLSGYGAGYGSTGYMNGTSGTNGMGTTGTYGTGTTGTGMFGALSNQNASNGTTTSSDTASIYRLLGSNVRILTVYSQEALNAMDRLKGSLNSSTAAKDIQTIINEGTLNANDIDNSRNTSNVNNINR